MPFGGTFDPVEPGTIRSFSFNVAPDLVVAGIAADAIESVSTTLTMAAESPVNDQNAANLAFGRPLIKIGSLPGKPPGAYIVQLLGGPASPTTGFQAGAVYCWTITVQTIAGQRILWYVHLPCVAIT